MKAIKFLLPLCVFSLLSFTALHKYYISVSEIQYVKDKQSLQVISRYFIDDFENALRQRYDTHLTLSVEDEDDIIDVYTEQYLNKKFKIDINGKPMVYTFLGKEYKDDIMLCYLEIEGISKIKSIEITSQVLQDVFPDQQNIIKLNVNSTNKSYRLNKENPKGLLKF